MSHYLLDTNIARFVLKGNRPDLTATLACLPVTAISISAVTKGELQYGLARCGYPRGLSRRIHAFVARVRVLPWDAETAEVYGELRARWASMGIVLGSLDMMIAAHAVATGATLVTRDRALASAPAPLVTDGWVVA